MEAYFIPFKDAVIVYRPLRHTAFLGNQELADYVRRRIDGEPVARKAEIEEFLEKVRFWEPENDPAEQPAISPQTYRPTTVALMMTNQCNMRCVYCYANAGARSPEYMEWPLAKCIIDKAHENAIQTGTRHFSLALHGGGEPTTCWDLLTQSVEYARSLDAHCNISLTSNGMWSEQQTQYICANIDGLSISLDGTAAVQNRQRPLRGGGESFPIIERSLKTLDQRGRGYGIRVTVMPESVGQLRESVAYVLEATKARIIQIEPTYTCSRGVYSDVDTRMADAFCEAFVEAAHAARKAGRFLYYSAARPWAIASVFCSAPTQAFVVAPGGALMTCFEVFSSSLPNAGAFTIGHVRAGRIEIDFPALTEFYRQQQARRASCRDCYCYWHCCGDCASRTLAGKAGASVRCQMTKRITRDLLACYMADGEGLWMDSPHNYQPYWEKMPA